MIPILNDTHMVTVDASYDIRNTGYRPFQILIKFPYA